MLSYFCLVTVALCLWRQFMSISREQEFKTTLTKTDFLAILNQFDFEPGFSQMNT
ncbi:MAG: CYTH domain-containing protein, partial [Lacticaseibacillus paracasei]